MRSAAKVVVSIVRGAGTREADRNTWQDLGVFMNLVSQNRGRGQVPRVKSPAQFVEKLVYLITSSKLLTDVCIRVWPSDLYDVDDFKHESVYKVCNRAMVPAALRHVLCCGECLLQLNSVEFISMWTHYDKASVDGCLSVYIYL